MTGKEKCELLKSLRREIAEKNGIIYLTSECHSSGNCRGTCPKCDAEARYLDSELNRIAAEGGKIEITGLLTDAYETIIETVDTHESNDTCIIEGESLSFGEDDDDLGVDFYSEIE